MKMRTKMAWFKRIGFLISLLTLPSVAFAQDVLPAKESYKAPKKEYSPFVGDHFPTRVLWGDTHLHTSWSGDAGLTGATLGPDTAYRVTRGEIVTSYEGWKVKLHRPLDWVVVADHAENLGIADFIRRSGPRAGQPADKRLLVVGGCSSNV